MIEQIEFCVHFVSVHIHLHDEGKLQYGHIIRADRQIINNIDAKQLLWREVFSGFSKHLFSKGACQLSNYINTAMHLFTPNPMGDGYPLEPLQC